MSPRIEVDEEIFELLQHQAEPLVDTPSTVLRRLLNLDSNGRGPTQADASGSEQTPHAPARKGGRRRKRSSATRGRAARGSLLPESEYELPILRYLDQHDGRAPSREVIDAVGVELEDKLTPTDKETLRSGDVRWKSRAAFVRLRLVERGDLDGNAPRGTWQITDQGRQRLRR